MKKDKKDLTNYVMAGFPFLYVETFEIKRAVKNIEVDEPIVKIVWNMVEGLSIPEGTQFTDPISVIEHCSKTYKETLVVLENYDPFLQNVEIVQHLLNNMYLLKNNQTTLCMVGSPVKLPPQLEKIITIIDFPLPSIEEFNTVVKDLTEQVDVEFDPEIPEACLGLSLEEGENAVALQLITDKTLNKQTLINMKRSMVRKTGFMDIINPEPIENIGGLENVKRYVTNRMKAWEPENKGLPKLKSIFLMGVPGTGKTLFGKVLASLFNWPLIIADVGAMKGGIVGETERKTREFTYVADAIGKCIILIDELEKAFAGASGAVLDSGVSQGQLGHFLTWMQERKSEAILVATVNKIKNLPPEFLRAGRWDVLFFVDFPNPKERKEIINIMNRKWNSNIPSDDETIERLEGWTGAEIEQLAKDSHFEDFNDCIESIPTIKKTKMEEVKEIVEYGKQIRKANGQREISNIFKKRKVGKFNLKRSHDQQEEHFEEFLDEEMKLKLKRKIKGE